MVGKTNGNGGDRARQNAFTDVRRIQAELDGSASADPFTAVVRATRMPIAISDPRQPDNPIVFVNEAFCRMSGYAAEEILGRNCRFLQGEDTDPRSVMRVRRALEAGEPIEIDLRNYRKDGQAFWNRLMIGPVRNASGQVAYFVASQVDVTIEHARLAGLENQNAGLIAELKEKYCALQESESRLRRATAAGRLGIWDLDLRTRDLMTSGAFRTMFGRDSDAPFSYEDFLTSIRSEDVARIKEAVDRSVVSGADYELEHRVAGPDLNISWVLVRAQVQRSADGTPERLAGTALDVTERKRAELHARALVDLDDQFRDLHDPAILAYAAAEMLGRTLDVSRAGYGTINTLNETITIERDWNALGIQSLTGTLRFRDYGSYIEDLKRGETVVCTDARADLRTLANADALIAISAQSFINMPVTEAGASVALLYLNHKDARRWLPDELALVREVAQRTRMAVERRRAEQDLRNLADTLESQVAARTRDLMETEAALRQAQKMEAVGQLTGGLAHDFNNLLTGISGSLDLVQKRIAQGRMAEVDRYIIAAQGASRRAAALTHRLLAFSRRQTLDPKPTDVCKLIHGMTDLIRRTVGPAIHVETVDMVGLWTAMVDPNQLENALLNLAINARDAMPDGGRLTIENSNRWMDDRTARERDLPPGQYLSICVSDTGTGMPAAIVARAFDPFFTTKPIGQGTGLGLSMIYGFARQSGGQVRIYSEPGQGTTVCIYLPRHYGAEHADESCGQSEEVKRAEAGEVVLVVDDEPTVRMLVTDVLGDLGYGALEAEDGPSGLKLLQSSARVDLLVTDVGLPNGMNGRQVADAARELRPDLKVLFITGYAENAAVGNGHLEPGMALLTKPFAMNDLAAKIRSLIEA